MARASFLDARPSDFESIPEQTEMNLGPGARPSDYPEAAEWQDPAPPQGCCTPVSAAIKLDTEEWGSGPAAMAWADGVFGISWPSEGSSGFIEGNLRFRTVDPKNLLVSALEEPVEAQAKWGYTPSLAWANDRFALAYLSQGEHGRQAVFTAILNEHGYAPWGGVQSGLPVGDNFFPIVRYTAESVWLLAVSGSGYGPVPEKVTISAVDDRGSPDGRGWVPIGESDNGHVALTALKSRAFALWGRGPAGGFFGRSFSWPYNAKTAGPELSILPTSENTEDASISVVAFRDVVIAGLIADEHVLTFSIDPWTDEVLSGPHQVATVGLTDWVLGIGVAQKEGYLGVCYVRREEGDRSLFFRFIGPDGRPWSPEHVLTTGKKSLQSCAVGFDGENWAVAWRSTGNEYPDEDLEFQLLRPEGG